MVRHSFEPTTPSDDFLGWHAQAVSRCRRAIIQMTSLAGSGHPGGSMSSLDVYLTLWACDKRRPCRSVERKDATESSSVMVTLPRGFTRCSPRWVSSTTWKQSPPSAAPKICLKVTSKRENPRSRVDHRQSRSGTLRCLRDGSR